jgi:hypothetical protein
MFLKKFNDSIQLFVSATVTVILVKVALGADDRKSGGLGVAIGDPAEPVAPFLGDKFLSHLCDLCSSTQPQGLKVESSIATSSVGFNEYFLRWSMELDASSRVTSGEFIDGSRAARHIDEAGQMSLAGCAGPTQAAKNVVLLGAA